MLEIVLNRRDGNLGFHDRLYHIDSPGIHSNGFGAFFKTQVPRWRRGHPVKIKPLQTT